MNNNTQSHDEEVANSISHGLGLIATIIAVYILINKPQHVTSASIAGTVVFSITMILLYLSSTLYHALPYGRAKQILLKFDHGSIYFFIAGSYTPFVLGGLNGLLDWVIFSLIWVIALVGATLKALEKLNHPWISTGLYLLMGWLVLIAALPFVEHIPVYGVKLLFSGGLAYSIGVIFFILDSRIKYGHTIWHGFVVVGSSCHFIAVLNYAA